MISVFCFRNAACPELYFAFPLVNGFYSDGFVKWSLLLHARRNQVLQ